MPKLHDELGQDDWDGQDWADDSTHQVSQRTEEKENYQGAYLVELDDGGYVSNWKSISDQRRQDTDYTCEKCRVRLQDNLKLLHVHHINRDKQDNCHQNLQVLCVICHSTCEDHAHLKQTISIAEQFLIEVRRKLQQGLPQPKRKQTSAPKWQVAPTITQLQPEASKPTAPVHAPAPEGLLADSQTFFLHEYTIVARFWRGQFRALAKSIRNNSKIHVLGESMQDVVQKVKAEIQAKVDNQKADERALLPTRHREYLEELGRVYRGIRPRTTATRRTDKCYACHTFVDNSVDLECIACGWIICSHCAACGCGYSNSSRGTK